MKKKTLVVRRDFKIDPKTGLSPGWRRDFFPSMKTRFLKIKSKYNLTIGRKQEAISSNLLLWDWEKHP